MAHDERERRKKAHISQIKMRRNPNTHKKRRKKSLNREMESTENELRVAEKKENNDDDDLSLATFFFSLHHSLRN